MRLGGQVHASQHQVSDSSIVSMFITFFLILLTQPFFIENDLKKEFERYKKYLRLKRIRAYRFEELRLVKGKEVNKKI